MYKVYRKGNYLHVVDLDNDQIWNASVDRAFIEKMFDVRDRYNFYSDYPLTAPQRFLDGIFLEHMVDENDLPWTLEDFEHFRTCKIGFYPIKPACDEIFLENGDSAYEIAVNNGFVGTELEWLDSLVGATGATGATGGVGPNGPSAYEVAVSEGFVGNEAAWLASLVGPAGADGVDASNTPLTWIEIDLINGWANTGVTGEAPFYAIDSAKGLMYLRGKILHNTLTLFNRTFWEAAPTQSIITDTAIWDNVSAAMAKLRLHTDETMSYQGPNNPTALIVFDSAPVVRLY